MTQHHTMSWRLGLRSVTRAHIANGGWKFDYQFQHSSAASRWGVFVKLERASVRRLESSLIDNRMLSRLPKLPTKGAIDVAFTTSMLAQIDRSDLWGEVASVFLILVEQDARGVYTYRVSDRRTLICPFQPVDIDFDVGSVENTRALGSVLAKAGIPYEVNATLATQLNVANKRKLFFHGSHYLKPDGAISLDRGLNCITFLDLALGCGFSNVMGKRGPDVVRAIGGEVIYAEGASPSSIKSYFGDYLDTVLNNYVMWWDSHCVIVTGNIVCEYSKTAGGYRETPVLQFLRKFRHVKLGLAKV